MFGSSFLIPLLRNSLFVLFGLTAASVSGQATVAPQPSLDSLVYIDDETVSVPLLQLHGVGGNFSDAKVPYLSYLKATPYNKNGVALIWTKTDERRAAYYTIQRSPDGRVYRNVGRMRARGRDAERLTYSFYDRHQQQRKCFYRLRQVNRDGSESYSHEVIYERPKKALRIALIPNPDNKREYTVRLGRVFKGEQHRVELVGPQGKRYRKRIVKRKEFKLTTKGLANGVYTLRVLNEDQWLDRRVVVY